MVGRFQVSIADGWFQARLSWGIRKYKWTIVEVDSTGEGSRGQVMRRIKSCKTGVLEWVNIGKHPYSA